MNAARRSPFVRAAAALVALLVATAGRVEAAFSYNHFDTFESRSRQFVVTGVRPGVVVSMPDGTRAPTNLVRLEPAVVAVNCERVKEVLLRELHLTDQWRGRIRVSLLPEAPPTRPIAVNREWYSEGWQFRVLAPHYAEPAEVSRAITGALALELANRLNPSQRAGEVPLWVVEGLAAHLRTTGGLHFLDGTSAPVAGAGRFSVVDNPRAVISMTGRFPEPYREAREVLRAAAPMSFKDLSLPRPEHLTGAALQTFRSSSHVFVSELLKQPEGPARFVAFLQALPSFLNAQLAFEHAWQQQFKSALDIEKWWSVVHASVLSRDEHRRWTHSASLQRLDELLLAHVEARAAAGALPERRAIKLQLFLGQAQFSRERGAIANLVVQLTSLQSQAPHDLARLIADYRAAFTSYLQKRERAGQLFDIAGKPAPSHKVVIQETIKQLDVLDVIRDDFRKLGALTATPVAAQ
ncbi:MAG: hypothetical protein FJ386_12755 [Verrucomicrobia bacterium]|nr:hypothetical protein [Verrucomicrobiota bacterium]